MQVSRIAYRAKAHSNLCPADGALNLPGEKHSHGLRRVCAVEAARGSYQDAQTAVGRACGQQLGKRQIEQLANAAAVDFESFYAQRASSLVAPGDVLVLSCDGKGVVMRHDALRPATAKAAKHASPKLDTRLFKRGEAQPQTDRRDRLGIRDQDRAAHERRSARPQHGEDAASPKATHKWLCASVVENAATVVADLFDEACRRDGEHQHAWVALVDGNNHQIDRIKTEAKSAKVTVTIVVDLIHVLQYLWGAAWCFYDEGDPAAEQWVHEKALAILE